MACRSPILEGVSFAHADMLESTFWGIRYTVLSCSLLFALIGLAFILRHKLYNRVIMVYVSIAVICEGIMALSALFFTNRFTDSSSGTITLTTESPWLGLAEFQGFLFRAAELTSFAVTTAMTFLIYLVVADQIDRIRQHKRLLLILSTTLPSLIIAPAAFYKGNAPCFQGDKAFNCACPNYQQPYYYYIINWMVPCIVLTAITIFLIVLIERKRRSQGALGFREEQTLALKAYYVPVSNFIFLIFNIILDSTENRSTEGAAQDFIMCVNLLIFLMPVVNFLAILRYKSLWESYFSRPSQISSNSSKETQLQTPIMASFQE